jgi:flavocytochrome c
MTMRRLLILVAAVVGLSGFAPSARQPDPDTSQPDVLVVGAGISGLSAALEAGRGGASVLVVDMWSIFGGHAVMSHGGLCIVGTPVQERAGIVDSPELAKSDFLTYGEDAHEGWVDFYVHNSREMIYDWISDMGLTFSGGVTRIPGNSVARFHNPDGRGLGLVSPIYRACLLNPNVRFQWNFKVDRLISEEGRVRGVEGTFMRTGERGELRARRTVLATGGFQSNLEMVREYWPEAVEFPEEMLIGSGLNSVGSGHRIAEAAGADFFYMDHQWNYATGLPDPRYPEMYRGLNASNAHSIWVNMDGKRFVNETGSTKDRFKALLEQEPQRYWSIFDEKSKRNLFVSGSDWANFEAIERILLGNGELVKTAHTVEELAKAAGLPPDTVVDTVRHYNTMIDKGKDEDFGRFDVGSDGAYDLSGGEGDANRPRTIDTPPFYALPFYPMTRKNMGGVRIDLNTRVLDKEGQPIPGLYAVGELTGFGGINGSAGLEGTFLGPSIVTGRTAGRTILEELSQARELARTSEATNAPRARAEGPMENEVCETCHDVSSMVSKSQPGYSHFEKVHEIILERQASCAECHSDMFPYDSERHRIDRVAQIESCKTCHLASEY